MDLYRWRSTYEIGHTVIDNQHRELVGLINRMYNAMKAGSGDAEIEPILDALYDYAQSHFTSEEDVMRSTGFPGLASHQGEHLDLTRRLLALRTRWKNKHDLQTIQLLDFLRTWFVQHISVSDIEIGRFLRQR